MQPQGGKKAAVDSAENGLKKMQFEILKNTTEYTKLKDAVEAKQTAALFGLPAAARAQFAAMLAEDTKRSVLVITPDEAAATRFAQDCAFFGVKSVVYPARDFTLRNVSGQNHEYEYRRLSVLGDIVGGRVQVVCSTAEAVLQHTMPRETFMQKTLTVKQGMQIKQSELTAFLVSAGYTARERVDGDCQFSVRGGIVDIFAPDMKQPARLEFWGDEIDNISTFDVLSQRRDGNVKKIYISPAREVLCGDAETTLKVIEKAARGRGKAEKAFEKISAEDTALLKGGVMPSSLDKYMAFIYEKPAVLTDYLDSPIIFIDEPSAVKEAQTAARWRFDEEIKLLLEQELITSAQIKLCADNGRIISDGEKFGMVLCENFARSIPDIKLSEIIGANAHSLPSWGGDITELCEDIKPLIEQGYHCTVLVGTQRAVNALIKDLTANGITAAKYKKGENAPGTVSVSEGRLSAGVDYPFAKLCIITGRRSGEEKKKKVVRAKDAINSLSDITPGDYVVHQNHGIGQYSGIQRLDMHGVVKDYIKVNYDKGDVLYVPVTQLDLISRYTAPGDNEKVKLARLGGADWSRTKGRVREAADQMAKELIELYARRQQAQGYAFPEDNDWQRDFETRFEYDETDDQLQCAEEIKRDMISPHPMDRLLCGDVGVGKTEVALRAAFKCVMGGKQCAILVPTTILAWQHYETAVRRMSAFPIKIGLLSRFRTPAQQKQTVKDMAAGVTDIVVGTHRLLQKDIKFKNLGLVIIDEEQRFGVKHKEKLKENFIGVDMLTLSATPIPRTLNMAMSGIRDMSNIEQPPFERQPIETYVLEYDNAVIEQAIRKELARAGQVYYLHNRIDSITACAEKISKMVPQARIGIAHGRMAEAELSNVWQQLLDGEIDILVCTTLIETGVDVRNCNTLIIEDADRMGLAQLYQIRGRVGRSGRRAYAYFTFRQDKILTDVAAKRLSAIREFTSFGSGLRIAMRDLQIRGVGSLLGQSQHGHMQAVGYDMYVKILNQAVSAARGEEPAVDKSDCLIDITVDAYIPESYIPSAADRIEAYKRIAAIQNQQDADDVEAELCDRYGKPPKSVKGLVDISMVRTIASAVGVYEITQRGDTLLLYSDRLRLDEVKKLLREFCRRITVNASAKPYIGVRIMPGEKPVDIMNAVLCKLYDNYCQAKGKTI